MTASMGIFCLSFEEMDNRHCFDVEVITYRPILQVSPTKADTVGGSFS